MCLLAFHSATVAAGSIGAFPGCAFNPGITFGASVLRHCADSPCGFVLFGALLHCWGRNSNFFARGSLGCQENFQMLHRTNTAALGAGFGLRADFGTALRAGVWGLWVGMDLIWHIFESKCTTKKGALQFAITCLAKNLLW